MPKKPLQLPAAVTPRTRVSFVESDELLLLTDQRRWPRIVAWGVAVFGVALMIGAMLWLKHLGTLPNQHRLSDQVTAGFSLIVLGVFILLVLPLVIVVKGLHRSFRVRVDILRRTCVCSKRVFGVPIRKREVQTHEAQWDVDAAYVQHEVTTSDWSVSGVVIGLILFLLGPIGWIIAVLANTGRTNSRSKVWEGRSLVRLMLSERGDTLAVITVPDESVAQDFLLAWDRQFVKPVRTFR